MSKVSLDCILWYDTLSAGVSVREIDMLPYLYNNEAFFVYFL